LLAQARVVTTHARVYLILNVIGASALAVDAWMGRQWGFLLLEGIWAMIAAWGLALGTKDCATRAGEEAGFHE
jgi:hypothetical protein